MRNLVLLLIGFVIGVIGATSTINALRQRDAYPRGLMQVMQHHFAMLREDVRHNRCTDTTRAHIAALHDLSTEIGVAVYSGDTPDAPFREYEQRLREALVMPANCSELSVTLDKIKSACDACHREYR